MTGIASSNSAKIIDVRVLCMCVVCCVGSGLCDELTARSDECYRVCVCVCLWCVCVWCVCGVCVVCVCLWKRA